MWTSRGTWQSPSQWNKFRITHKVQDIVLSFSISVTTRQLSLNFLSDSRQYRHDLIRQMVAERFTNQQMADVFNRLGMKTPSGKQYYAELVGATVSKLRKRDVRKATNTIKFMEMTLFLSEDSSDEKQGSTP